MAPLRIAIMTAALWLASHLIEAEGGSDDGARPVSSCNAGEEGHRAPVEKVRNADDPWNSLRMQSYRKVYRCSSSEGAAVRRKSAWRASIAALCKSGAKRGTMNCDACGDLEDGDDRMLNLLEIA